MAATDQKVRENPYVDDVAKTSRTVAYKESTPLNNTHLLVAQVNISTANAIPLPAGGWVEVGTGGANSANQMRTYAKQGDGSTNSITITSDSALATVLLTAYAGYNGLTPILAGGGNGGNGSNFPFSGISGPAGDGVALLGIGLSAAPAGWGSWSAGQATPALAEQPAAARGWWAALDYVNGTGAANTTVTWGGTRTQRYIAVVMPLVAVATAVSGSITSSLPAMTQAASATVTDPAIDPVSASLATPLSPLSQSATADYADPGNASGSIATQLPALASAATATVTNPTQPSGTTTPTRSQMPAAPFDLYPAPAYSWGAGSAPSGAGYTTIAPDSSFVKLLGAARKGTQAGSVSGFVNPAPLQDIAGAGTGTNPLVYPAFGKRILTNSPEVWFKVAQRSYSGFSNVSARAAMRPRVNRKWTSMMPTYAGSTIGFPSNPENITAGEYWMKMTFPDSQLREIELNDHLEFGGVVIPSAYTFSTPSAAEHVLVVLDGSLGAAEKHQTGNFSLNGSDGSGSAASYTAVTSYVWALAQILGYDSVVNVGAGSSGFSISGDTASWKSSSKVPVDVLEHLGDLNLVGSANNDQAAGQSTSQVDTASNTVYGLVAAGAKSTAINVAVGMFTPPAAGSQSTVEASVAPYNTVLKARAQQNGFYFINPTTGQFYDPQGNLLLTTSNWVYQDLSDISSDNTHPTQRGANNMGAKMAEALKLAHVDDTATPAISATFLSTLGIISQSMQATTGGTTPTPALYGPTGQHWPDNTPGLNATFGYDVTVAPSWTAIGNAIDDANTAANQAKLAVIRVTPGSLLGNGAGATSTPVLKNIGMVDRPGGRILIIPRDGVGSVDASSKSLRFLDVRGTSFIGFNTWQFGQAQVDGSGVLVSGCKDFAYGWAKARFWNIGNRSDVVLDRVQFVELVANESFLYPEPPNPDGTGSGAADRIQWYNSTSIDTGASGASGTANKPEVIGCFMAPVRVWQNDAAHLDGLQIYGTGSFTDVLMKDTVLYAASHQGFISSEIANIILDHSLLIGGDTANDTQFPLEPNAFQPENAGAPWPVNGAPSSAIARNGTKLYGSPKTWPLQYDATSGQESRTSLSFLNTNAPVPTDQRLQQMWSFTAETVPTGTIVSTLTSISQTATANYVDPAGASGGIVTPLSPLTQSMQASAVEPASASGSIVTQLSEVSQSMQATALTPSGLPWLASFEDGVNPYTLGPTSFDSITTTEKRFGDYSLLSDTGGSLAHRARVVQQTFLPGTVMRGWVRAGLGTPSLVGIGFASPDTLDNVVALIDTRNSTGVTASFQVSENRQAGSTSTTGIAASENVVGERWYMIEAVYTGTAVNAKLFASDGVTLLASLNRTLTQTAGYASYRPTIYGYNTAWYDNISVAEPASDTGASILTALPPLSQLLQATVQNPNPGGITLTAKSTTSDLEAAYLGTFGVSGSLSDRRKAIYGQSEHAYFAARSGLGPGFSLADHKLAYYAAQVGQPGGLRQLERTFYLQNLGL